MTKFGVAQPVRRVEDPRLLKGAGSYTADYSVPGMLHGVVLRSPHAHAKILSLDVSAAAAVPGVHAVFTNEDLKADKIGLLPVLVELDNRDGSKQVSPPRHTLAEGQVRHVGEPLAFIVAETMQAARDAAEAVMVDYDILESVTDLATATNSGVPQVWPTAPGNLCFDWEVGPKDETEALFKSAAHVTKLTVVNNRIVVNSMEARACLADYDTVSKTWTIRTNTQGSWTVRNVMAGMVFGLDPSSMRVITPDVGGGFGMKLFLYPEHVLTTYASRKLGRPVRWVSERSEAFLSDSHGRDNITEAELAAARERELKARADSAQAQMTEVLADRLARMSEGDMTARIDVELDPSFAKIKSDYNSAIDGLARALRAVAESTGGIQTGANEITSASDDLSRRTEQQAASLEETAAALDEITATVARAASARAQIKIRHVWTWIARRVDMDAFDVTRRGHRAVHAHLEAHRVAVVGQHRKVELHPAGLHCGAASDLEYHHLDGISVRAARRRERPCTQGEELREKTTARENFNHASVAQCEQVRDYVFDLLRGEQRFTEIRGRDIAHALGPIVGGHHAIAVDARRIDEPQAQLRRGEPLADACQRRTNIAERRFSGIGHAMTQKAISAIAAQYRRLAARGVAGCGRERRAYLAALDPERNE